MILDLSALVAIVLEEPDFKDFLDAISLDPAPVTSAGSWLETAMVVDRRADAEAVRRLADIVARLGIRIAPFTSEHAVEGRIAWSRFGKGSGHPAQLNFGDCIAYKAAKSNGLPLLFKGNDFPRTDIAAAV